MERCVLCCLFVCVFMYGVEGQVGSLCRPKERLLACGCPKTCEDPVPNCAGVCKPGCYCEEDEVRNETGECVKLADCPPSKTAYKRDTTEPRENNGECPENEEYRFCEPCPKSCGNPNPVCRAQCARGCFCKNGLLRHKNGTCVNPEHCGEQPTTARYKMTCTTHQVYKSCETCEKTCSNPAPVCPQPCAAGCFCDDGFVKAPNGSCVELKNCPQAAEQLSEISISFSTADQTHEVTIEDCTPEEEYLQCGWCEPSCSDPMPVCAARVCTRGCLCKPPLLRHHSGKCVDPHDCHMRKCRDVNEDYVCHYGCERTCQAMTCDRRMPRTCMLGCYCKLGLLRDLVSMRCVPADRCPKEYRNNNIHRTFAAYLLNNYYQ